MSNVALQRCHWRRYDVTFDIRRKLLYIVSLFYDITLHDKYSEKFVTSLYPLTFRQWNHLTITVGSLIGADLALWVL